MTDSPYGPQASHRLDGDVPESGAHPPAVSGQIVPAGAYDPAGRSQDPLSPGRADAPAPGAGYGAPTNRSEEHTSELQSRGQLVCRLLLEKKMTASGAPYTGVCA